MKENANCLICDAKNNKKVFSSDTFDLLKCRNCNNTWLLSNKRQSYEESYYIDRYAWYKNYIKDYNENEHPIPRYKDILTDINKLGYGSGKILEVGCSKGLFLHLAQREGFLVYGIDISEFAVKYVKDNFNFPVKCSDLIQAKFPDNSFDIIVMIDVIEHLDDPKEVLCESYRILRSGGLIVIDTPNEDSLINRISSFLYNVSFSKIKFFVRANHDIEHLIYFSPLGIEKLLSMISFKVLKTKLFNIDPEARGFNRLITLGIKIIFKVADIFGAQNKMVVFASKGT